MALYLSFLIFLPLLGGLMIMTIPLPQGQDRNLSFLISGATLILACVVLRQFEAGDVIVFKAPWIDAFGFHYHLMLDGLTLPILMSIVFLSPLLFLLFSHKTRGFWGNLLFLQGSVTGTLFSQDLILFYLFWEMMLLPVFFMTGMYGSGEKIKAAYKVTLYTFFGSLLMLVAIIYVGFQHYQQMDFWSFSLPDLLQAKFGLHEKFWLFWGFVLAFAIKIPLFPFHTWLPTTYVSAPAATVVLMSSIMAKLGVYGILRFVFPLFPEHVVSYSELFVVAGLFGLIYFGITALMQKDIKRLLAYSSASHLSMIVAGVFSLNLYGMSGALFLIFAHAISTGVLFILAERLEDGYGTRNIADLGGIASQAPRFTLFFGLMVFTVSGLPGTNGFVAELLIILGIFKYDVGLGLISALTVIVAVSFMLWMFGRAILGESKRNVCFIDLPWSHSYALGALSLIVIIMGVYPEPFLEMLEPVMVDLLPQGAQ
jgi:NADH-quinone oxidoreductase subunit M